MREWVLTVFCPSFPFPIRFGYRGKFAVGDAVHTAMDYQAKHPGTRCTLRGIRVVF